MSWFSKLFGGEGKPRVQAKPTTVLPIGEELRDGCFITCGACGRQAKVRMFDRGKVALIGPNEMRNMQRENIALKCQDCGYVICFSCSSSQTGSVGIPTCPSCKKEGGPYFFTT